jgi:hypothetical protein
MFMTISPADLHWNSVVKLMPNYNEWKQATEEQRVRISRSKLRNASSDFASPNSKQTT